MINVPRLQKHCSFPDNLSKKDNQSVDLINKFWGIFFFSCFTLDSDPHSHIRLSVCEGKPINYVWLFAHRDQGAVNSLPLERDLPLR